MPGFEEEALERARKISQSRRAAPPRQELSGEERKKPEPPPKPAEPPKEPPVQHQPKSHIEPPKPNMLEALLKDKETSLILTLLLLLMDEKNDPSLLFALMYMLM